MGKILIICDSEVQGQRLSKVLEENNFNTITTTNSHHGIALAKNENPALIITEIVMPDLSAFEIITRTKENNNDIKIIAMAAPGLFDVNDHIKAIKSFGADMVLKKPFRDGYLIRIVKTLLYSSQVRG